MSARFATLSQTQVLTTPFRTSSQQNELPTPIGLGHPVDDPSIAMASDRAQYDSLRRSMLDDGMADLLKFERAFQVSSRAIDAIDELLDRALDGLTH